MVTKSVHQYLNTSINNSLIEVKMGTKPNLANTLLTVITAIAISGCVESTPRGPIYSSRKMDTVMRGSTSFESYVEREVEVPRMAGQRRRYEKRLFREKRFFEHLSDWQLEREKEWNVRDYEFVRCDRNKDGQLTGEEATEYISLLIFNYRFR